MGKTTRFYVLASVFAVVFVSCNNGNGFPSEKQQKIEVYIHELGANKPTKSHYLIVPQYVCPGCVEATYEFLEQNKIPINIILVGQTTRDSLQLSGKYTDFTVYLDRNELYYNRKNLLISTQNMMFFTVDNGIISNYHEINVDNITSELDAIQQGISAQ